MKNNQMIVCKFSVSLFRLVFDDITCFLKKDTEERKCFILDDV